MQDYQKMYSKRHTEVFMKIVPGHFVTPNSHINYYIDMTTMKTRMTEAQNTAKALAEAYASTTVVDTIICMDNTEVIGAYLAEYLTGAGVLSKNAHRTIYVISPEYDLSGQMIFRENMQMMVRGKNVLFLLASTTTGTTLARAIQSVKYYGGYVSGISAIFSVVSKIFGYPVHALFSKADLVDYKTYKAEDCPLCKAGVPVDAIANGYGYSRL